MITLILLAVAIIAIGGFWPRIKAWISSEETKVKDEVDSVIGNVDDKFKRVIPNSGFNASVSAAQAEQDKINTITSGQAFASSPKE